jgi:nucleotide-binding universal stress UspA family protein
VDVVMTDESEVPGWVMEWRRRTGRHLRIQPSVPADVDRIRAIARLTGHTVLVPRVALRSAGPRRVVAAVGELPEDTHVLTEAANAAAEIDGSLLLVHAVPLSFGERSVGLDAALARGRRVLAAATRRLAADAPDLVVEAELRRARPHELVGEELDADLLVIGGPRAQAAGGLGLVATSAIQHAPCPVLVAPRRN